MKILFVCTGNTCRSPMAEAIFNEYTKNNEKVSSSSAGLAAVEGSPASERAINVCKEIGIDLKNHKSKMLDKDDINQIDLFVCMTNGHASLLKLLNIPSEKIKVLSEEIEDPYLNNLETYRICRDQINKGIINLCKNLNIEIEESL